MISQFYWFPRFAKNLANNHEQSRQSSVQVTLIQMEQPVAYGTLYVEKQVCGKYAAYACNPGG